MEHCSYRGRNHSTNHSSPWMWAAFALNGGLIAHPVDVIGRMRKACTAHTIVIAPDRSSAAGRFNQMEGHAESVVFTPSQCWKMVTCVRESRVSSCTKHSFRAGSECRTARGLAAGVPMCKRVGHERVHTTVNGSTIMLMHVHCVLAKCKTLVK